MYNFPVNITIGMIYPILKMVHSIPMKRAFRVFTLGNSQMACYGLHMFKNGPGETQGAWFFFFKEKNKHLIYGYNNYYKV